MFCPHYARRRGHWVINDRRPLNKKPLCADQIKWSILCDACLKAYTTQSHLLWAWLGGAHGWHRTGRVEHTNGWVPRNALTPSYDEAIRSYRNGARDNELRRCWEHPNIILKIYGRYRMYRHTRLVPHAISKWSPKKSVEIFHVFNVFISWWYIRYDVLYKAMHFHKTTQWVEQMTLVRKDSDYDSCHWTSWVQNNSFTIT